MRKLRLSYESFKLLQFLEKRLLDLEAVQDASCSRENQSRRSEAHFDKQKTIGFHNVVQWTENSRKLECSYCKQSHYISSCSSYKRHYSVSNCQGTGHCLTCNEGIIRFCTAPLTHLNCYLLISSQLAISIPHGGRFMRKTFSSPCEDLQPTQDEQIKLITARVIWASFKANHCKSDLGIV